MKKKTGVLLINLGTPDSPSFTDVAKYLFEFLNDPRVIDIPAFFRFLLVNFIIVPFRTRGSSKIYKELWTDQGSPLLFHTRDLAKKLGDELSDDYEVFFAMRYKNPNMEVVLEQMKKKNFSKIIMIPLYPQYASASTGSSVEKALQIISKWWVIPELEIKGQFFDDPNYIQAVLEPAKKFDISSYDHILFSYHGLPERQVDKVYFDGLCQHRDCESELNQENYFCYKAGSYYTTKLLVEQLGLKEGSYTTSFQSRLDNKWLTPFSDHVLEQLAKEGKKKVLVFCPSFTADCLETTIEIGTEYRELFTEHGGEQLDYVESLNSNDSWVHTLKEMIEK